jgi:serine/threonine protein kinase
VADELRSIIQTKHPDLADQVRNAIDVMERVLELAGPLPLSTSTGPSRGILETAELADSEIGEKSSSGLAAATSPKNLFRQQAISLAAGEAFGRYQIVKMLGKGAMGAVFLAYDPALERHVAIKIPTVRDNPVALERFYIEARATATLRSPNICPVYDVAQINGVHYISMAFIDGEPLTRLIEQSALELPRAAEIIIKTARGIQKAHERGVVHRDLKPDNIMIDSDGEPVVMDFGLAWRDDGQDARLTKNGSLLGTPAYMSPEQAMGKQDLIGPTTDIYSLGVVLYHMLTQKLPFEGSVVSVLKKIVDETPKPPSAHNPSLSGEQIERICLKMMEKSPSRRYPCMGDVAQAVEESMGKGTGTGRIQSSRRFSLWPFKR